MRAEWQPDFNKSLVNISSYFTIVKYRRLVRSVNITFRIFILFILEYRNTETR